MTLENITYTAQDIENDGNVIENNIIDYIDVNVIGHFNNCPTFEIICSNVTPFSGFNNTKNIGFLIKAFFKMFDLCEEDGISIDDIRRIPCRLIFEKEGGWGSRCIGFGHFMKDKFVYSKDFAKIDE